MSDERILNLKNAMVVVLLDGSVTEEEKHFIESLRRRLGVDRETFQRLVQEVRNDPKRLSLPRNQEATETLRLLTESAAADGWITPAEHNVLQRVAEHLGLGQDALDKLLPEGARAVRPEDEEQAARKIEDLYTEFASWDPATRRAKLEEIASHGRAAVEGLLRVMESYRTPDGLNESLDLKILVAENLGRLGDDRVVYYLAQQVSLGDGEDEVSSPPLRQACAAAIGRIVGQDFPSTPEGVRQAREWWNGQGRLEYNQLTF